MPNANDHPAAVFFDAYGTLISWEPALPPSKVLATGLWALGVEVSLDQVQAAVEIEMSFYRKHQAQVRTAGELARLRRDAAILVRNTLGGAGACPVSVETIVKLLLEAFATSALPDAQPAIDQLQGYRIRTGVLSNFSYLLPLLLDELGLTNALDPIVFSAAEGVAKPDPSIFEAAARAVGVETSECVLIGDDLINDVEGARGAEMPVIWVNRHNDQIPSGVDSAADLVQAARMVLGNSWRTLSCG